jgi:hypothetical protein
MAPVRGLCVKGVSCTVTGIWSLLVGIRHRNGRVECITVRLQFLMESLWKMRNLKEGFCKVRPATGASSPREPQHPMELQFPSYRSVMLWYGELEGDILTPAHPRSNTLSLVLTIHIICFNTNIAAYCRTEFSMAPTTNSDFIPKTINRLIWKNRNWKLIQRLAQPQVSKGKYSAYCIPDSSLVQIDKTPIVRSSLRIKRTVSRGFRFQCDHFHQVKFTPSPSNRCVALLAHTHTHKGKFVPWRREEL